MINRSDAIKNWLQANTHNDLADLYNIEMEVQVNVIPGSAEQRVEKEFKGRTYAQYTDGLQTWGSFRIPRGAKDNPHYEDIPLKWSFEEHLEAIGMTGWNWKQQRSVWVGFDFDSITTHEGTGITENELNDVLSKALDLPYVTARYSTSGSGYHLYIFCDVHTRTHTEHAAVARSLLGKMCADTGYDFAAKVDACGGILWQYHRKMIGTDGLKLIKQGTKCEVPKHWQEHLNVIKKKAHKVRPSFISDPDQKELFDKLMSEKSYVKLDNEHMKLFERLDDLGALWEWKHDHHLLVCHTYDLKQIYDKYNIKGIFKTLSEGRLQGADWNCFCYPVRNGGWSVRRYTPGVQEEDSWAQDSSGYTQCYFNVEPDLTQSAKTYQGIEDTNKAFVFSEAVQAIEAAKSLGAIVDVPSNAMGRETKLKEHKDGRLVIEMARDPRDDGKDFKGWLPKKTVWQRIYNVQTKRPIEPEIESFDDIVRHLITEEYTDGGWVHYCESGWVTEPITHIKAALAAYGYNPTKINQITGNCIKKPFVLVNRPFQPEYLGDRKWNRNAAQLKYQPGNRENLHYPTWTEVLNHCGRGLDHVIKKDSWCIENGINKGGDYLKCWMAAIIQKPEEPLPYLFFYGPENSGKSIFHESFRLLVTNGYKRADQALINPQGFNAELEYAVMCVVEETDLRVNKQAMNRIKDWVTGIDLLVHKKNKTPFHVRNCTHWCQFANDARACPVGFGDTRITMVQVFPLSEIIPKRILLSKLKKEAPDFLTEISNIEIPDSGDRLALKVINTPDKVELGKSNMSGVQLFLDENTYPAPGYVISLDDMFRKFLEKEPNMDLSKRAFNGEVASMFPKGRIDSNMAKYLGGKASHWYWANVSFEKPKEDRVPLVTNGEFLTYED